MAKEDGGRGESSYSYEVFLSFRGEDTRKGFTDHLHAALLNAGFRTFRDDDDIRRCEHIQTELDKAIEQSRVSIVIFSKTYASSRWCLDELAKIIGRKRSSGHCDSILPLFIHVDPSEIRNQRGSVGSAFESHKKKFDASRIQRWRDALKKVANFAGMDLADGGESEFIQKVIRVVRDKLRMRTLPSVGRPIFGIDYQISDINLWLNNTSNNASILLICGMGGIVDEGNKLVMHDLVREMGKKIVRDESPKYPEERSRLWRHEDSFDILRYKSGTKAIEGLILDMNMLKNRSFEDAALETDAFQNMRNLRILKLDSVQLNGCHEKLPKKIRWLHWRCFHLKTIPSDFPLSGLVILDLTYSKLERFWEGTKILGPLKILNFSHSPNLLETPDFSKVPNLEKLILKDCPKLFKLHRSIIFLRKLILLDLEDCKNLRELPTNISDVESLECLIVSGCWSLEGLADELSKMKLKDLYADNVCRLLTPKSEAEPWTNPQISLKSLPRFLVNLSLVNCNLPDDAFPMDLSNLSSLQRLDLAYNKISKLPDGIKCLTRLRTLMLSFCPLKQIQLPAIQLQELNVSFCSELEEITFESSLAPKIILHIVCPSLRYVEWGSSWKGFEIKPVGRMDVEVLNKLGFFNLDSIANVECTYNNARVWSRKKCPILVYIDRGILFNTFFPGTQVPHYFNNKSDGSTISLTVPSLPNRAFPRLNLCLVYTRPQLHAWEPISVESKGTFPYFPGCYGNSETDIVWLLHLEEFPFESGDKVDISFSVKRGKIKECGVLLLYDQSQCAQTSTGYNDADEEEEENVEDDTDDDSYYSCSSLDQI